METIIEVESKILEVWHKDYESKILELWWKMVFNWIMDAIWLESENWKKVRIRKEWDKNWDKVKVEFKNRENSWEESEDKGQFKVSKEDWFFAKNFDKEIEIYKTIWYKEISRSIKRRVSYLIEENETFWEIKLEFDKYSDLDWMVIPELLELEWDRETIVKVAKILWFNKNDLLNWDAWDLVKYYRKNN
jgi:hypothetical protein